MHNNNITFSTKQFPSPSIPSFILFFIIYNKIPLLSLSPRKPSLPLHSRTIVTLFYLFFSPRPRLSLNNKKRPITRGLRFWVSESNVANTSDDEAKEKNKKQKRRIYLIYIWQKRPSLRQTQNTKKLQQKSSAPIFTRLNELTRRGTERRRRRRRLFVLFWWKVTSSWSVVSCSLRCLLLALTYYYYYYYFFFKLLSLSPTCLFIQRKV